MATVSARRDTLLHTVFAALLAPLSARSGATLNALGRVLCVKAALVHDLGNLQMVQGMEHGWHDRRWRVTYRRNLLGRAVMNCLKSSTETRYHRTSMLPPKIATAHYNMLLAILIDIAALEEVL